MTAIKKISMKLLKIWWLLNVCEKSWKWWELPHCQYFIPERLHSSARQIWYCLTPVN